MTYWLDAFLYLRLQSLLKWLVLHQNYFQCTEYINQMIIMIIWSEMLTSWVVLHVLNAVLVFLSHWAHRVFQRDVARVLKVTSSQSSAVPLRTFSALSLKSLLSKQNDCDTKPHRVTLLQSRKTTPIEHFTTFRRLWHRSINPDLMCNGWNREKAVSEAAPGNRSWRKRRKVV